MTAEHMHDEPPYDPEYDAAVSPVNVPHDRQAERALLAAALQHPEPGSLANHVDPGDFWEPVHETIWTAWHKLLTDHDGTDARPDAVMLNSALVAAREVNAVRALADVLLMSAEPVNAAHYAATIRDLARRRAAQQVGTKLCQLATSGGDVNAVLEAAVTTLDEEFARFGPKLVRSPADTGLADLSWVLSGQAPEIPPPSICRRTDGTALFYAGKVNGLFGDPESAKTWIAQAAGIEALADGGSFTIIDTDHNGPRDTAARLLLLGARPAQLADPACFRYYEPEDGAQLLAAVADTVERRPTVVVLDSLGEMFPMLGASTNDGDELTDAMRKVCTPPAVAGSCVITIDHLPKGSDARATGYAIGSIAKKRMIRGSYLRADARAKPAPGQIGRITLRIEKDTAGKLREASGGGYAGTFTLDSTSEHVTTWSIGREEAPRNSDGTFRPTKYMELVSKHVEQNDLDSQTVIENGVGGKREHVRTALKILIAEGFVTTLAGPRGSKLHHSVATYREDEDEKA